MTIEEVKDFLLDEALPILSEDYGFKDAEEAIDKAVEALEKQIPKRRIFCRTSGGEKGYMCPSCNRIKNARYVDGLYNYCEFCGQALDWGDEK